MSALVDCCLGWVVQRLLTSCLPLANGCLSWYHHHQKIVTVVDVIIVIGVVITDNAIHFTVVVVAIIATIVVPFVVDIDMIAVQGI